MPVEFGEGLQIYSLSIIKSTQTLFTLCFSDITLDVNHLSVQWSYPKILIKCSKKKQLLSKRALFSVYNYIFTYYMFLGVVFSVSRCCMLSIPQRRRKIKNKREAFTFHQFYKTLVWNLSTCLKR